MSKIHEIENAVRQLSAEDLAAFRDWFAEFDAQTWDRQFEEDVAAGRFKPQQTLSRQAPSPMSDQASAARSAHGE